MDPAVLMIVRGQRKAPSFGTVKGSNDGRRMSTWRRAAAPEPGEASRRPDCRPDWRGPRSRSRRRFQHRRMIRHTCAARRARLPCRGPGKPAGLTRPGTEQRSEHGHEPPPRNLAGIEGGGERLDRDPGRIRRRDHGPPGLGLDHGGHAARRHPLRHGGGVPAGDHHHEHRAPRAGPVERAGHRDEGPGRRGVRRRLSDGEQPRGGGAVRRRLPLSAGRLPQHRGRSGRAFTPAPTTWRSRRTWW